LPIGRLDELAQLHRHLPGIGKLNSNGVFPGNGRENVDSLGARCSCKVALEAYNLVHAHALCGINFIPRNGWTFGNVTGSYGDSKLRQRLNENLLDLL